ncbi:MAG: hypothetical protein GC160_17910 [Acidobacteria bacterium]|nr:hypothetical protein [Acidobacteriota bacterium]
MTPLFSGPLAALLTPRERSGELFLGGLDDNLELGVARGVKGFVLTGGTGEYPDLSLQQRKTLLEHAAKTISGRAWLVASCGAMRLDETAELASHALGAGADAILLPPPHFYRYGQQDLEDFFRAAAARIDGPILVYNLAGFTSPIDAAVIVRLIETVPNIVGVKDSSGKLDSLELLTARPELGACRILGNDLVLVEAIERKLLDGVISGPASVIPEAVVALFDAAAASDTDRFAAAAALFREALSRLERLPYPWALKLIAEARGLFPARLPFESGPIRRQELADFGSWLEGWLPRLDAIRTA